MPSALRSLAALLRAGVSMSAAITEWAETCPPEVREAAATAGRLVALGAAPEDALEATSHRLGGDVRSIAAIARLHSVSGCDAARLLEGTAHAAERRDALERSASIATSGTKLSGRIVAALPLLILPLVPAVGGALFDRRGSLLLVCGGALLLLGAWWIARLLPRPRGEDEVAELAALAGAAVDAGVELHVALGVCTSVAAPSLRADLDACAARVRLGASWSAALRHSSNDGLHSLGRALLRTERLGTPVARSLDSFARRRADEAEAAFDRAIRRAPVLMVLPLTTCILPGYAILAVGPLVRGLSFG